MYRVGEFLQTAGLVNVQMRQLQIPIHTAAGRLGQMGVSDYLAVISGLKGPLVAQGFITAKDFDQVIQAAREEMSRYRVMVTFPVAFGQRPRCARHRKRGDRAPARMARCAGCIPPGKGDMSYLVR